MEQAQPSSTGSWLRQHRWVTDLLVGIVIVGYETMYIALIHHQRDLGASAIFAVAAALLMLPAYALRRRWPITMFAAVYAISWAQTGFGLGLAPGCMAMMALVLFNLASHRNWTIILPALTVSSAWIITGAWPMVNDDTLRIGEVGLIVLGAVVIASLGALARHRRGHMTALQDRADQLARERDAREAIAAAEERARIAREIHDIVSHSLGTMVVMADGAAQTVASSPEQAGHAMERVRDTGRDAMGEMRRMLDVLRDDSSASRSPQPGLGRLDRLIDEARQTGLRVDLNIEGEPVALPAGLDLAAYRIVQESLTNARKHGGPLLSVVTVTLSYAPTVLSLHIVDDGSPAATGSAAEVPWTTGHGLVGMRERASAYGGSLEAGPRTGGGFEVHAVLPIGEE